MDVVENHHDFLIEEMLVLLVPCNKKSISYIKYNACINTLSGNTVT